MAVMLYSEEGRALAAETVRRVIEDGDKDANTLVLFEYDEIFAFGEGSYVSPMELAACYGLAELIEPLVARGASFAPNPASGHPPIYFVGDWRTLREMLRCGADPNTVLTAGGGPPESIAQHLGDEDQTDGPALVAELIRAGAERPDGMHGDTYDALIDLIAADSRAELALDRAGRAEDRARRAEAERDALERRVVETLDAMGVPDGTVDERLTAAELAPGGLPSRAAKRSFGEAAATDAHAEGWAAEASFDPA